MSLFWRRDWKCLVAPEQHSLNVEGCRRPRDGTGVVKTQLRRARNDPDLDRGNVVRLIASHEGRKQGRVKEEDGSREADRCGARSLAVEKRPARKQTRERQEGGQWQDSPGRREEEKPGERVAHRNGRIDDDPVAEGRGGDGRRRVSQV